MIKTQILILGILSLVAIIGTTTTVSNVFASSITDAKNLIDKAIPSIGTDDVKPIIDNAIDSQTGSTLLPALQ